MKKRMLARNQQQGIVEGSVIATTSIAQADQKAHRPSSASTIFATIPPQHIVLREERKKKKQMEQSQGLDNQAQGVQITKSANTSSNDNIETVQVGAFPSTAGRGPTAANAHVDDEATPSLPPVGPIIEAMPFEESEQTETQVLKALLKSRKCRIMLALTVLLIVGLIVAVVLVTRNSSKALQTSGTEAPTLDKNNESSSPSPQAPNMVAPGFEITPTPSLSSPLAGPTGAPTNTSSSSSFPNPNLSPRPSFTATEAPVVLDNETQAPTNGEMNSASDTFITELKPLLSQESLTALNNPDSPQSQSFQWLLEKSNFQAWPFPRQVQQYAMATFYYATGGDWSWFNGGNWLTNETKCLWFQGSRGDFCGKNGTALQSLNQSRNILNGTLPDEIKLLSSLRVLDLLSNQISGTVPSELGSLTALTYLELGDNAFTGTVPSELGSFTALSWMSLYSNGFKGAVLMALGSLTTLTFLDLSVNSFTGTVPSELGSLTALTYVDLFSNGFKGTVPSELGSLTALTRLSLYSNALTGTVPSELGALTALTYLDLSVNAFIGTVPSELGSLTLLEYLDLYTTSIDGTVPAQLCNIRSVTIQVDCNPGPQCSCCVCHQA